MSIYSDCFRALRLVRSFMTLIGLLPVNMRLRRLHISLLFILVAFISFMQLWNFDQSIIQSDSELSRVVNIASLLMLWIVHLVILLETSCKTKQFDNVLLQFEKLEKSLLQQNCEAPSALTLKFRGLKIYIFLLLEILELLFLVWILHLDGSTWFSSSFRIYSEISLRTILFQFMLLVILTNAMQQDLCSVTTKAMNEVRATQYNRWTSRQNALKSLRTLGNIRNEIWMVAKMIEDICECSLIGVLLKMYCDITFTAYWIYVSFDTDTTDSYKICTQSVNIVIGAINTHLFIFLVFIIFIFARGFILLACCWICTSCEMLESNFIAILPFEDHKRTDTQLKLIIKDLSLEMLHKRIQFSAGDIIAINFRTLGGMIFSAITYVVILIQFRMTIPPDKEI